MHPHSPVCSVLLSCGLNNKVKLLQRKIMYQVNKECRSDRPKFPPWHAGFWMSFVLHYISNFYNLLPLHKNYWCSFWVLFFNIRWWRVSNLKLKCFLWLMTFLLEGSNFVQWCGRICAFQQIRRHWKYCKYYSVKNNLPVHSVTDTFVNLSFCTHF